MRNVLGASTVTSPLAFLLWLILFLQDTPKDFGSCGIVLGAFKNNLVWLFPKTRVSLVCEVTLDGSCYRLAVVFPSPVNKDNYS